MSRADDIMAKATVEAKLADLEDRLTKGKKTPDLKAQVRVARQEFRELREAEGNPDGAARPAAIKTAAGVRNPGGK